jgi:hypothetical protein
MPKSFKVEIKLVVAQAAKSDVKKKSLDARQEPSEIFIRTHFVYLNFYTTTKTCTRDFCLLLVEWNELSTHVMRG